jgi:hypothetical protein
MRKYFPAVMPEPEDETLPHLRLCAISGSSSKSSSAPVVNDEGLKLLNANARRAQAIAERPFESYPGELVVGSNPLLDRSFGLFGDIAGNNIGAEALNAGLFAAGRGANYQPQAVRAGGLADLGLGYVPASYSPQNISARNVTAQALAGTDLKPYMNPFQSNVIDTTMADLERSRRLQRNADAARASAAGAFGGSRHGVADSLTNEAFGRTGANTLANLNLGNFSQAQNAAVGDIARRFGADQANQQAGLSAGLANQQAGLAAAQLNQQGFFGGQTAAQADLARQLQASLANQQAGLAGADLNLRGGGLFGALSDQQLGQAMTRAGAANQAGQQQRSIEQQHIDAAFAEFLRRFNYPVEGQQLINQAAGLVPASLGSTSTSKGSSFGLSLPQPGK